MNAGTVSPSPSPAPGHPRRTAADRAASAGLAVTVLVAGFFTGVIGPLIAIACGSCQDGVRGPLRFDAALIAVAQYAVPLVTLGTVAGVFASRSYGRAACAGLGVLAALLVTMLVLGRFTA
ncbi:hypothetical protein [Streptomyces barkulensis]|uniref:hypothetical protein n=1 Tax=Streptomyces barkulensis TaxID=1257026 RepID=UPI000C6DE9FD|nr:hypothetical protein [Streptomyces barkulensis]